MIWQIQRDNELDEELWYLGQDSSDDWYLLTVLKVDDLAQSSDFEKNYLSAYIKTGKTEVKKC